MGSNLSCYADKEKGASEVDNMRSKHSLNIVPDVGAETINTVAESPSPAKDEKSDSLSVIDNRDGSNYNI